MRLSTTAAWSCRRAPDDELDRLDGRREEIIGKVQERYGYERDEAEREVDEAIRRW